MIPSKPFAPSAERNKHAILEILKIELAPGDHVFEFGSGSGQHACYFSSTLQDVVWQPTDLPDKLAGISLWIEESGSTTILDPLALDLSDDLLIKQEASVCYTANTFHIVSLQKVEQLFRQAFNILRGNGKLIVYGPFSFNGEHTSDGNRAFDLQLRNGDRHSGIRDFDLVNDMATNYGFVNNKIIPMPANNHIIVWST